MLGHQASFSRGENNDKVKEHANAEAIAPLRVHGLDEPVPGFVLSTGTLRQQQAGGTSRLGTGSLREQTLQTGGTTSEAITLTSLEPGAQLGPRYQIRRVLGSGGMGMVFQAHDTDLDEPVALKVLRPEILMMDPTILERFKRETKVARRITHRNVVRTYDFGEVGGMKFISMEFVQGMTLKQLVRSKGALPVGVGVRIAKQACAGLAAAHEQGVVHRDIKPRNIMLTPQSEVKIMDFGIARPDEKGSMTQTGLIMGTPDYMSPEQAQGKQELDHRSDIYSMGIVLYELFTGELPFTGKSAIKIAMKHVQEQPKSPRQVNPSISEAVERVILRCIHKNPAERYQTVAQLQQDLFRLTAAAAA